ncbi:hypothetical protein M0805_004704 [Coniferiporia weirii]|nr:hypothetical protein M0805_004704 [Coniferiporia weirii]
MSTHSKRVHFSELPVMHTYSPRTTPRTPSPSWSDNSLPDNDSGPSTPPSASSFASRTLPPAHGFAKPQVALNPLFFDIRSQSTPLVWNVANTVAHAGRKGKGREINALLPSELGAAATSPAMISMDIHIAQLPPIWKPIQLRRDGSPRSSSSRSASPITVGEVLEDVRHYIHIPVSEKEFHMFPKDLQSTTAKAYWKRHDAAAASGNAKEAAAIKKAGMLRLDVLAGNTQFCALVPAGQNGDVWQVVLARP